MPNSISENTVTPSIKQTGKIPSLDLLLEEIRQSRLCEEYLPLGCRQVLSARSSAKILIVGQAPGTRVHETGIP